MRMKVLLVKSTLDTPNYLITKHAKVPKLGPASASLLCEIWHLPFGSFTCKTLATTTICSSSPLWRPNSSTGAPPWSPTRAPPSMITSRRLQVRIIHDFLLKRLLTSFQSSSCDSSTRRKQSLKSLCVSSSNFTLVVSPVNVVVGQ